MGLLKLLIPLAVIGGGIALIGNARASEKKKRVDKALDLGLDDVDIGDAPAEGPLPPAMKRAVPQYPINRELFNEWWYQTGNPETGVMGFYDEQNHDPIPGTEWLLPTIDYDDVVLVTNDGAFWYFDDGWHPGEVLALKYDSWYTETHS